MKCFLIRDLLPLYAEGQVSKETKEIIEQHFKQCEQCRELYNSIIDCNEELKDSVEYIEDNEPQAEDGDFWRKYYGSLYMKGIGLFIAVVLMVIEIVKLIRYFN